MAWNKVIANSSSQFVANGFNVYKETAAYTSTAISSAIPGFTGGSVITVTMQSDGTSTASSNNLYVQVSMDGTNWATYSSAITCVAVTASASSVSAATYDMTNVRAPYVRLSRALTANSTWTWAVAWPNN